MRIENSEYINIICDIAKKSFPIPLTEEEKLMQKVQILCAEIDDYFKKKNNNSYIGIIGVENADIRVWCDSDNIYIKPKVIQEIFDLGDSNNKLTMELKCFLAEKKIIKTHVKNDGKLEYSVVVGKCFFGKYRDSRRHVAFDVKKCEQYDLFPFLREYYQKRTPNEELDNKRIFYEVEKLIEERGLFKTKKTEKSDSRQS